ncbi:hypothetical protein D3C78_1529640 [compost metagenome]
MASTSMETPRVSLSRMNSCRCSEQICPQRVRKSMAVAHSASVSSTSLMNPWRCSISDVMTVRRRGWMSPPMRAFTLWAEPASVKYSIM